MTSQWCSITEYSRQLNISEMTVRRRIKSGKLVTKMADGKYYIDMACLKNTSNIMDKNPKTDEERKESPSKELSNKKSQNCQESKSYLDQYIPGQEQKRLKTNIYSSPFSYQHSGDGKDKENRSYVTEVLSKSHLETHKQELNNDLPKIYLAFEERLTQFEKKIIKDSVQKTSDMQEVISDLKLVIQAKDHEIERLKQNQEDLELLVKMLDPPSKKDP